MAGNGLQVTDVRTDVRTYGQRDLSVEILLYMYEEFLLVMKITWRYQDCKSKVLYFKNHVSKLAGVGINIAWVMYYCRISQNLEKYFHNLTNLTRNGCSRKISMSKLLQNLGMILQNLVDSCSISKNLVESYYFSFVGYKFSYVFQI